MFQKIRKLGFQIETKCHAEAILNTDFQDVITELDDVLSELKIPIEEIIGSGGGEAKGTQRLRRELANKGWKKQVFEITKTVNGREKNSISHEVDHVRTFPNDTMIALEIEWNNKDPFFDRDLENFKRLHEEGVISVGVVITRGSEMQSGMRSLVHKFMQQKDIQSFADLENYSYVPTPKQKTAINTKLNRSDSVTSFADAFVDKFVSDKFGQATTHWDKLQARVTRGVGNPCPMLFIGLPKEIVTFDDD
jgi:hypothetical protein